jgi:hypothetical protein
VYVDTIVDHFYLGDAKSTQTPMEPGTQLSIEQSPSMVAEAQAMQDIPYQRAIGSLMYMATSTRPDLVFPVVTLSQFMHNPGRPHWEATKCALQYLKGTADFKLTLGQTDGRLEAFIDADWASQPHRHLMSGYIILLNGGPVAWSTRKQPLIALSTAEAEYIALTSVICKLLYLQLLISELYEPPPLPIPVFCDNQAAIALALNGKFQSHTKHIDLWYHFIRLHVRHLQVVLLPN